MLCFSNATYERITSKPTECFCRPHITLFCVDNSFAYLIHAILVARIRANEVNGTVASSLFLTSLYRLRTNNRMRWISVTSGSSSTVCLPSHRLRIGFNKLPLSVAEAHRIMPPHGPRIRSAEASGGRIAGFLCCISDLFTAEFIFQGVENQHKRRILTTMTPRLICCSPSHIL